MPLLCTDFPVGENSGAETIELIDRVILKAVSRGVEWWSVNLAWLRRMENVFTRGVGLGSGSMAVA
jgi:hypothetical protein